MSALADACARGALDKLTSLDLNFNKIGDAGMNALAGALARGALASCQYMDLFFNPGSGAPVKEALAARKK